MSEIDRVKQGETLSTIARGHGFRNFHTIFDDPNNPVGDMMRAGRGARQLTRRTKQPFTWNEIVNAASDDPRELVFQHAWKC